MKKHFFLFLLLVSSFANAQNAQDIIATLKKELKANPDAKKTATIYSDLTWYYSNVSIDSALHYGQKAIQESKKVGDSTLIAQVYSDVGAAYFRKGDYQNSKQNYLSAYKIRKARKDFVGMNKINANLANIYNKEGNKQLALKTYFESLDFFEKQGNVSATAQTKANIGFLLVETNNYNKALKYINDAIVLQKKIKDEIGLSTSYITLGNAYLKLKDTVNSLNSYNKSLLLSKKIGNKLTESTALVNIGAIKKNQQKSEEAKAFVEKSKLLRDSLNLNNKESIVNLMLIRQKIDQSKFGEAKKDLLELAKTYEGNPNEKETLLETYQELGTVYSHLKMPDSTAFYLTKATRVQNDLINTNVIKQTAELETKYQTEKKEKLLLQKETEAKQKNLLLTGISLLAFFIALIGFLIYRQQKLKTSQQEKEFELKSAISKIETQNKLQEQRLSISRDLHDNIGAQLTFIISSVDNIKYAFDITNKKLDSKLSNISSFAKETIIELRDTIWAMNSNEISFEDLEIRINNYIEKAKEAKDQISFSFAIDPDLKNQKLTSVQGMNIYRTIQEAVNNSIKYANASVISINAKVIENQTKIIVQDNGLGFDLKTIEKGNGLQNMQKRIEEINGKFHLSSSNEGTRIEILLKNNSL
jgi:signal transduction histidine kinase